MSLKLFFRNLKYLRKYSYQDLYEKFEMLENMDNLFEQVLYETPNSTVLRPQILNYEQTISELVNTNKSIIRFGDGELSIIEGNNILFQDYDKKLAEQLKLILQSSEENLLIGINYEYYYPDINLLNNHVAKFYRYCVPKIRNRLTKLLNLNTLYASAGFTQLYVSYKDYDFSSHYENLKKIWNAKKVLLVGCKESFKCIEYNIFDNASSIDYLYISNKNAFSDYDKIYDSILKYDKDTLIILMAGPCGKVLGYDLFNNNYRVLDLGHLMKDYDWYNKSIAINSDSTVDFMLPDE